MQTAKLVFSRRNFPCNFPAAERSTTDRTKVSPPKFVLKRKVECYVSTSSKPFRAGNNFLHFSVLPVAFFFRAGAGGRRSRRGSQNRPLRHQRLRRRISTIPL